MKRFKDMPLGIPFVLVDVNIGRRWGIIRINSSTHMETLLDEPNIECENVRPSDHLKVSRFFEVEDWLDDVPKASESAKNCNCDLFTVLMRSGCKCGGL